MLGREGLFRVLILLLNLETCPSEQVDLLLCFTPAAAKPRALLTSAIGSCQMSKWSYTEEQSPVSELESAINL